MLRYIICLLLFSLIYSCQETIPAESEVSPLPLSEDKIDSEDYFTSTIDVEFSESPSFLATAYFNVEFTRGAFSKDSAFYLRSVYIDYFPSNTPCFHIASLPTQVTYFYSEGQLNALIDFGLMMTTSEPEYVHQAENELSFENEFNAFHELTITMANPSKNFYNPYAAVETFERIGTEYDTLVLVSDGFKNGDNKSYLRYECKQLRVKNIDERIEFSWQGENGLFSVNDAAKTRKKVDMNISETSNFPKSIIYLKANAKRSARGETIAPHFY